MNNKVSAYKKNPQTPIFAPWVRTKVIACKPLPLQTNDDDRATASCHHKIFCRQKSIGPSETKNRLQGF